MAIEAGTIKERRILESTEENLQLIIDLQFKMDSLFDRQPRWETSAQEPTPTEANILDEILQNLSSTSTKMRYMQDFVQTKVIEKIS